jgi:hypothetical protein
MACKARWIVAGHFQPSIFLGSNAKKPFFNKFLELLKLSVLHVVPPKWVSRTCHAGLPLGCLLLGTLWCGLLFLSRFHHLPLFFRQHVAHMRKFACALELLAAVHHDLFSIHVA